MLGVSTLAGTAGAVTQPTTIAVSGVVSYPGATMGGFVQVRDCQTTLGPITQGSQIAADGSYSFLLPIGCTGGSFSVAATSSASDLTYSVSTGPEFTADADKTINFTLPVIAPLTISVTDTQGTGLSGAWVEVTTGSVWPTYPVTVTGAISATAEYKLPARRKRANGIDTVTGADGRVVVQLPANASSTEVATYDVTSTLHVTSSPYTGSVDATGGAVTIPLDVTPPKTVTVSGHVSTAEGGAVTGSVGVSNCSSAWGISGGSSPIAADGSYAFPVVAGCTGGTWALSAVADGSPGLRYALTAQGFTAPDTDLSMNDVVVPTADAVAVSVVDQKGAPVGGAAVSVGPSAAGWPTSGVLITGALNAAATFVSTASVTTDGTGVATLPVPAGSSSDVEASKRLSDGTIRSASEAGLAAGASTTLTLDLTEPPVVDYPTVTVSGTVTQGGQAAFGGTVWLANCMVSQTATASSSPIDADGSFSLPVAAGCTGGTLNIDATPLATGDLPLYLTTGSTFSAPASATQVNIDVPATVPLTAHVEEASGSAVEGAGVVLRAVTWPTYTVSVGGATLEGRYYVAGRRRSLGGTTDASGNVTVRVPANATTDVYASIGLLGGLTAAGSVPAASTGTAPTQVTVRLTGAEVLSAGASSGSIGITTQQGSVQDVSSSTAPASAVPTGAVDLTGSLTYNITGLPNGGTAKVSITLPEGSTAPTALYKQINGTWVDLGSAATFSDSTVTITLTDGGLGDSDGLANGTIVDPLVLANVDSATLATIRAITPAAPQVPQVAPTGTGVAVQWTAPPASWNLITGYEVQVATKATGPFSPVASGSCSGSIVATQCVATLSGGKAYYFQVRAKDSAGWGPWSATSAGVTTALGAALKPAFGTVTKTATGFTVNVTNYNPAYAWTATTNAGTVSKGAVSGSTLPLTVTGLNAGQAATVTVTTTRLGYATGTASISGTAQTSPPSAPQNVVVTAGSKQVSVSWTPPASTGGSPITKYTATAWSSATGGSSAGACSPAKGALNCVISKLATNGQYFVDVTATNAVGTSTPSARVAVTVK